MVIWRLQGSKFHLINSEGAKLTGGRWNQPGTAVIYASEDAVLAAMEVIVHHGAFQKITSASESTYLTISKLVWWMCQTGGRTWSRKRSRLSRVQIG
jgi:RES domain-containing protein